jgi:hypothetical protein
VSLGHSHADQPPAASGAVPRALLAVSEGASASAAP